MATSFTNLTPALTAELFLPYKTCSRCREAKPIFDFGIARRMKDGMSPWCKGCRSAQWFANHERNLETLRESYQRNRDKRRAAMKEYRAANLQKILAQQRESSARHFFALRLRSSEFRSAPPLATAKELAGLWKKQRGRCALTGRRLNRENAHLDHIIPICLSGTSEISNLRWLDKHVNQAKRGLKDSEFFKLCCEVAERLNGG